MGAGAAVSVFSDHGVYLLDVSRWYLARIVEEFNLRGKLPTAKEVSEVAHARRETRIVDFYLGLGRDVEMVLQSHAKNGYYETEKNAEGEITYRVLPAALRVAANNECEERYWKEFRFKVC